MADRVKNPFLNQANRSTQKTGSGFTNLQRLLGANRGNRLGSTVSSGVGGLASQSKEKLGEAESQFKTDIGKSRVDVEANKQARTNIIEQAKQGQGPTEDQTAQFGQFRSGEFRGPTGLKDVGELRSRAQEVELLGRAGSDPSQRFGLLRKFVGGRNYTAGQQGLDALLLGQQRGDLRDIRRQTAGQTQAVERGERGAQQVAQELGGRARQFATETEEQLRAAADPTTTAIQEQLAARQGTEDARREQLQNIVGLIQGDPRFYTKELQANKNFSARDAAISQAEAAGIISGEQAGQIFKQYGDVGGLRRDGGTIDYPATLASRFQEDEAQGLTAQGVSTAEQAARLNALSQLGGREQFAADEDVGTYKAGKSFLGNIDDIDQNIASQVAERKRLREQTTSSAPQAECFAKDTMIRMADDTFKAVQDLSLLDEVYLGGMVLGRGEALTEGLWNYNGVEVSDSHVVLEDGIWLRVGDSKCGKQISDKLNVVYPVYTEHNLIVTENQIWADFAEVPNSANYTEDQRIEMLNERSDNDELVKLDKRLKTSKDTDAA